MRSTTSPSTRKISLLAKINTALLVLIIVVNGYIIITPLVPAVLFPLESHHGHRQQQLQTKIHQVVRASSSPQPNHLVIPSMLLDQPVQEGTIANQYQTLDHGIWRWPRSSTPDKGGNTVLIGHRFTYTNPRGVFYYLDKVKLGDEIGLYWNQREYVYKVSSIREVKPTDTSIEDNTVVPQVTLFTCTPLWLPKDRLVVEAQLEPRS